jgi:hypothetical protein
MRSTYPMVMIAGLLVLGTASCGGDSALGPGDLGTGNVNVSGAVSTSGQGVALFQSVNINGTDLFQIAVAPVTSGGAPWQLQIVRYAERPTVGTYQLTGPSTSSTNPTASFVYNSAGTIESFSATSGQLVISQSSPSAVRGTFIFTATSAASSARTVTVQGSFVATCPPTTSCL